MALAADQGGEGAALLVLLHGLGATRQVWTPMLAAAADHWPGRWLTLDLPGHGASPPTSDAQAALVAEAIRGAGPDPDAPLVVLGHSMGGVLALALASGSFAVRPTLSLALGVKVVWTEAEFSGLAARAQAPVKRLPDESAAIGLYLKVSGLTGLVDPADPMARAGVVDTGEGWRLAMDPLANSVGVPDMDGLMPAAACPVVLASGANDPMSRLADLQRFSPTATVLAGLGHNAMVENPGAVWRWLAAGSTADEG